MKRFVTSVALLLSVSPLFAADPVPSAVRIVRTALDPTKSGGMGSGTVVHRKGPDAFVLTNRHVAVSEEGAPSYIDVVKGDTPYRAELVAVSQTAADLALLKVAADLPAAEMATAEPATGGGVRQFGFPHGSGMYPRVGRVLDSTGAAALLVRYQHPTESGDSGSGVFDDQGRLTAVLFGKNVVLAHAAAVRLADVKTFLKGRLP